MNINRPKQNKQKNMYLNNTSKTLNLNTVKIVYSTCSKFPHRQEELELKLKNYNLNFEKYEGPITETQWVGSCTNHKNILQSNLNELPLLVFEDDVAFTHNFSTTITYPENADAIFLGKSLLYLKEEHINYSHFNNKYTRLLFSFGLHGILYLNLQFKKAMLECFEKSLTTCEICDKLTGDLLKNYKVICPKKCWIYQDNKDNSHNKLATEYDK